MALSHCIVLLAMMSSLLGARVAASSSHHGRRAIHRHHSKHGRHGIHSRHGIRGNDTQGWLSGSATFYGLPTASGPPDNGNPNNALFNIHTN